ILSINAQDKTEKQPLYAILETVQNQYHYQFNYAKDSVDDLYIIPPSKDLTFNQTLAYLEKATGLTFVIDNENFVLVTKTKRLLICGYLKDKDSNTPIAFVTIQGQENTAISDENGFFQLLVNTISEVVTIRHLGYKTAALTYSDFDSKTCTTIHLTPNFQSLSEVMISNYIINGINKLSDGSFQIDFSNFDILPGVVDTDVLQSVQAFPGIQSSSETVSNLNIRGGSHDQNLILWDHIKMYQSGHFFGLISMYNPQITQRVTLRKNGSDVSQTDGVSGTISMETDNVVNTIFNGSLGANFIDINGFVDTPVGKKSSVQIAARKSISDFIKTPTYHEFFERISQNTEVETNGNSIINSGKTFDFYDTSLRWNYQISDKDELRLNFINVGNELLFNENAMINNNEVSRRSSLSQNSIAGGIFY
ncbi:MAG: carboxypeptidase-like regulatory domain-containing protein, partial [Gelidibacter sp.]|nr:carboxypeptidase-like regulatory domain-containing protein [Gelidibacter sp.]